MKKKLLSAFLAFTMIFSAVPSNFVFAEDQAPAVSQEVDVANGGATDEGTANGGATDEGTANGGATDEGTANDGATDEGTANDGATDEGTANGGATDEGTANDGATDEGTANGGNSPVAQDKVKPAVSEQKVGFFIRLNGNNIPLETGSSSYSASDYTAPDQAMSATDAVTERAFVKKFEVNLGETSFTFDKLKEEFATVYQVIESEKIPSDDIIKDAVKKKGQTFDPATQEVIWYVVKNVNCNSCLDCDYHVDGVIFDKSKNIVTLSYDANAGDESITVPGTETIEINGQLNLGYNVSTRENYEFLGWSEEAAATEATYVSGKDATIQVAKNTTLYAVWKLKDSVQTSDAGFYIRLSDRIIPFENGITNYDNYLYSGHPGIMNGKVVGNACVTQPPIDLNKVYYTVSELQGMFSSVNENIIIAPTNKKIKAAMVGNEKDFDENSETVIWYVVKSQSCEGGNEEVGHYKHAYHVDGIIVNNNAYMCMLSYDANTKDSSSVTVPSSGLVKQGESVPVSFEIGEREGYDFVGWSRTSDGEAEFISKKDIKMDKNTVLYAVWKEIIPAKDITLTYDAKGGKNGPEAATKTEENVGEGVTFTISDKQPTKDNYDFLGWSKEETATQVDLSTGSELPAKSDITLYAVWKVKTKTISLTYHSNTTSGDVTKAVQSPLISVVDGKHEFTVEKNAAAMGFTHDGYEFDGWTFDKDGKNSCGDATLNVSESVELFAQWKAIDYKVNYHSNFATGNNTPIVDTPYQVYDEVTLKDGSIFENPDSTMKFVGWSKYEGNLNNATINALIMPANDVDLYAVWTNKSFTNVPYEIQYVLKTNTPNDPVEKIVKVANYVATFYEGDPASQEVKHEFPGNYEGGYALVSAPEKMTVTSTSKDLVFTAQYEKNVYQVTYHSNNGANTTVVDTNNGNYYEVGSVSALATNSFNRSGYNFNGWSLTADGAQITEIPAIEGNVDVYARWAAIYYPPTGDGDETTGGGDTGGGTTPTPPVRPTTPDDEVIVDEDAPLARPEEDILEDLPDDETPLANVPEELELIDDEEVPLANAPKTGSAASGFAMLAIAGAAAVLAIFKKKHSN